jgi:hypothetical protein
LRRRVAIASIGAAALAAALPRAGFAQAKPLRFIVPYPPGGPLDIVARAACREDEGEPGRRHRRQPRRRRRQHRRRRGGQVGARRHDDRHGRGGDARDQPLALREDAVRPDPRLHADHRRRAGAERARHEPEVAARLGIAGVADLVAYAKKNPGKLNYGSGGTGSAGHLAGEMFKAQAGVYMVHIPYAGGNPAQLALLAARST